MLRNWQIWGSAFLFWCMAAMYSVFSYSLTDPNLVLSTWKPYWMFQQWMWQTFFLHPQWLTVTYILIMSGWYSAYVWLLSAIKQVGMRPWWWMVGLWVLLSGPLFFSYNALSHDVFNYLFNAKMVLLYHANPHVQVALNFPTDLWLRFMHNTHSVAPYGYGWTLFSLIPGFLGRQLFLLTWLLFRLAAVISCGLVAWGIWQIGHSDQKKPLQTVRLAQVLFLPFVLVEVVSTMHNDWWMMGCAVGALALLFRSRSWKNVVGSLCLLTFSISMKFATILLLPIWLMIFVRVWLPKNLERAILQWWPEVATLLLLAPLVTERSKQFLPWYLLWALTFWPLLRVRWLKNLLIVLIISSSARYVPWLWTGLTNESVYDIQRGISLIPAVLFLVSFGLLSLWRWIHGDSRSRRVE